MRQGIETLNVATTSAIWWFEKNDFLEVLFALFRDRISIYVKGSHKTFYHCYKKCFSKIKQYNDIRQIALTLRLESKSMI